jgi:hypothetical protein
MDIAALLASKILLNSIRDTKNRKKKKMKKKEEGTYVQDLEKKELMEK